MRLRCLSLRGVVLFVIAAVIGTTNIVNSSPQALAADATLFDPGYIISDANFYDPSAMSEQEIQQFLDSQIGSCSNTNCLNILRVDTTSRVADPMCSAYVGALQEPAARVIFKVQQSCGISAKVLLVTLQKEQSLITNQSPSSGRLDRAMGFACPDNPSQPGWCDPTYGGLYNQLYWAARQFVRYSNPAGTSNYFTWYPVGSVSNIRFNPNTACGASAVLIRSQATAALYYYTPYTPNSAALANLYGVGDSCSSYGNRNFWRLYSDWFGSTTIGPSEYIDQVHASYGGDSGQLGRAETGVNHFPDNGGGYVRGYEYGAITWTSRTGAFALWGAIRAFYGEHGGVAGLLGWPASPPNSVDAHGAGYVQAFENGAVLTSANGTWVVKGPVRTAFNAAGGIEGGLGWATRAEDCADSVLCWQDFVGGRVYGDGNVMPSAIRDSYIALGDAKGVFGMPHGGVVAVGANGGGLVQPFVGGAIAWSTRGGAHGLAGPVRDYFNLIGGIGGRAGWPIGDETCREGTCSQAFTGGTVYVSGSARTFVDVEMTNAYESVGALNGPLGPAIGSPVVISANGGGLVQAFAGGALAWSKQAGAYVISGDLRSAFNEAGGIGGAPGWPTSSVSCVDGVCHQSFQGGTVWTSPTDHVFIDTRVATAFEVAGGLGGPLGAPVGSPVWLSVSGGGVIQPFQSGVLVWSQTGGAHQLAGAMREYFNAIGGIAGTPGWPLGGERCDEWCEQTFQGGVAYVDPNRKVFVDTRLVSGYEAAGGPGGSLGNSLTGAITLTDNGGGVVQAFEGGALTWNALAGAHAISGDIRTAYNLEYRGTAGPLGWPTSAEACDSTGECSQEFQGGVLVRDSAGTVTLR